MTTSKEDLRRLVNELPDDQVDAARQYLEYLRYMSDPFLRMLLDAPEDDEGELTEETLAGLEEARQERLRGEGRPWEEVRRELLGE
ncbi:MAG: hypothetical protein WD533_07980 [Dehalococcoidia bacterium]